MVLTLLKDAILYRNGAEQLRIEAWGPNAVRVRSTPAVAFDTNDWALAHRPEAHDVCVERTHGATLSNGRIRASLSQMGKLVISDSNGTVLLEEFQRNRDDLCDPKCSAIMVDAREFRGIAGGHFHLTARFECQDPDERIYGMGQYQQPFLNLQGTDIELAQRNSQASVPFATSSRGYGFLWNNPSVGRVVFGKNVVSFEAKCTTQLDYWVVAGEGPREIQQAYASVSGYSPMMPEYGLGFWQCKLRYQTQEEILAVARKHRSLGLPMDVIVVDFFHWPYQGEWKFDPVYWPDPKAMIKELSQLGIQVMVSIWPTCDERSENFETLREAGHLVQTERGAAMQFDFCGRCQYVDFTNPEARVHIWNIIKKNYYDLGIKTFWLDEAEPEYIKYDFDNYRYHQGPLLMVGNEYPRAYARCFYEGQEQEGQTNIVNLLRCAWAGSQRYGALVWSGDIASSWSSFRNQLCAGLNMGLAGIPWWTTDIGGFHGGDPDDPKFRELFVRWFQWGAFCPVMRLHGDREPRQPQHGTTGGAECRSGAANEVWSYGPEAYQILKKYILLREELRPYTRQLMEHAHSKGDPVIRTLFYEFAHDEQAWIVEDEYMYGHRYLVAPILNDGCRERSVYLPRGAKWRRFQWGAETSPIQQDLIEGGQTIMALAPIDDMPVFERV